MLSELVTWLHFALFSCPNMFICGTQKRQKWWSPEDLVKVSCPQTSGWHHSRRSTSLIQSICAHTFYPSEPHCSSSISISFFTEPTFVTPCIILLRWLLFLSPPVVRERSLSSLWLHCVQRGSPQSFLYISYQHSKRRISMHVLGCVEYSVFCVRSHEFHEHGLWEGGWMWSCQSGHFLLLFF